MQVCQRLVVRLESEFYSVKKSHELMIPQTTTKHSFSMVENLLSRWLSFLLAYATGNGFSPYSCINIAPTPTSDVSTQSKKRLSCSGNLSMGRADSAVVNAEYALSCASFHSSLFGSPFLSSRSDELLWPRSWVDILY